MRALVVAVIVLVPSLAWSAGGLPNENMPGNSPTLPNANLPGSMPDDNPISLPNTDTSRAVVQPGVEPLFPNWTNVPVRNPSIPLTPEEAAALAPPSYEQLAAEKRDTEQAKQEAINAREEAATAREEAAAAREDAARAREETARVTQDCADCQQQVHEEAEGAPVAPTPIPPSAASPTVPQ